MAHLIEEYAKSLGVKIGKPFVVDHFYPTLHEKYITIHCDNKIDSKYYEYFPQVLNLIKSILNSKGYAIYQVGGPQDVNLNTDGTFLNLTYKQSIHLIKNSKLHVGVDNLLLHAASMFDIPIIGLYSNVPASTSNPYWSSKENIIILESDKGLNKPSYSHIENPKTIKTIKPEVIAESILKFLNINQKINFTTLNIGSHYHIPIVEIVPNFRANLQDQKDKIIYIRSDIHFDDQIIAFWCANYKSKIISNQKIPIELLKQFGANIEHVYFKIAGDYIENEYFEELRKLKIRFTICIQDLENLPQIKNKYFDFQVEFDNQKQRIEKQEKFNAKFLTNKVIISNGKIYPSEAHIKLEKTIDSVNEVVYSDDAFWKDAEHFYFYEQN